MPYITLIFLNFAGIKVSKMSKNDQIIEEAGEKDDTETPSPIFLAPSSNSEDSKVQALKHVHRKVDVRLLLWYSFVYLIMRIHVSNISNTAIINLEAGHGIQKQLGNLTSSQWAWTLSIF